MIYFFPMPYPDECLYSIFVRYDKLTGNNSYYTTISELLGNKKLRMNFSFSNNLAHLCNELPQETVFTPEYFIQNYTILPIYKPFIPEKRYATALANFVNGSTKSALPLIGSTKYLLNNINSIKYCPSCISDDKKLYGEAYLHRIHQVDGNLLCNRHKCLLNVLNAPSNLIFYDINNLALQNQVPIHIYKAYQELSNLSDDIEYLLSYSSPLISYNTVKKKYYSKLFDKGYIRLNGTINQKKLHEDFIDYYSYDFLEILKSNVCPDNSKSWLRKTTQTNVNSLVHPIRSILFIRFLFGDMKEFIDYTFHEIGLNKRQSKTVIRIKKQNSTIVLEYKKRVINLRLKEPYLLRNEINKRLKKEYCYLSYHEKDWLESILPKQTHSLDKAHEVDWNQKDEACYTLAYDIINKILENDMFERITINLISRRTNNGVPLYRYINKMPKTKVLIEKHKESIPEFHMRKIKIAIQKKKEKGMPIKPYKILREVYIPPNYRSDYTEYINSLIENI